METPKLSPTIAYFIYEAIISLLTQIVETCLMYTMTTLNSKKKIWWELLFGNLGSKSDQLFWWERVGSRACHGESVLETHDSGHEDGELFIVAEERRHGAVMFPGRSGHAQETPVVVSHNPILPFPSLRRHLRSLLNITRSTQKIVGMYHMGCLRMSPLFWKCHKTTKM